MFFAKDRKNVRTPHFDVWRRYVHTKVRRLAGGESLTDALNETHVRFSPQKSAVLSGPRL